MKKGHKQKNENSEKTDSAPNRGRNLIITINPKKITHIQLCDLLDEKKLILD